MQITRALYKIIFLTYSVPYLNISVQWNTTKAYHSDHKNHAYFKLKLGNFKISQRCWRHEINCASTCQSLWGYQNVLYEWLHYALNEFSLEPGSNFGLDAYNFLTNLPNFLQCICSVLMEVCHDLSGETLTLPVLRNC
jgi:hypothetical protein